MSLGYSQIAARGLERLAALSDGVFAIVMTLLILEIHVPAAEAITSDGALLDGLMELGPEFLTYFLSFMTLGIFWAGQQTQFNHFSQGDRNLTWFHIAFLASIAVLPFSTSVLASYITLRLAVLIYWANIFVPGMILLGAWAYARRAGLVREDAHPDVDAAIRRRIVVAQLLYAIGLALALINTYLAIGFIVLVQLNFAVAPRIRWLSRI